MRKSTVSVLFLIAQLLGSPFGRRAAAEPLSSNAVRKSLALSDLAYAHVNLINRWHCEQSDSRCEMHLSFTGTTLTLGPAETTEHLVPWLLVPVAGTADQFYIRSRWHCAQADPTCDMHLSFEDWTGKLYPAANTYDLVPWKFVPVPGVTDQFYIFNMWRCQQNESRCGMNLSWTGTTVQLVAESDTANRVPWRVDVVPQEEAYVSLQAKHSGVGLAIRGESRENGAVLEQSRSIGPARFALLPQGSGYVKLIGRHSRRCLDVTGQSTANGAAIQQYDCWGGDNQRFKLLDQGGGYFKIQAKHSGKCLDVTGQSTADGAAIQQYDCSGGDNQRFKLDHNDGRWDLVSKFAPRLRFDGAASDYPMSAQTFFSLAVLPPNRQTANGRLENTSYSPILNHEVPTYYQAIWCGNQLRIKYWWFYGYQSQCDALGNGIHNGDWENVMVTLSEDRTQIAAVTFWAHGHPYTRINGWFEMEDGSHPVVYAGKTAHGSYFEQGGSGNACLYWADWRNNLSGSHMDSWRNLVGLDNGTAPWMDADRVGGFSWGYNGVSTHPTQVPPTCSMTATDFPSFWMDPDRYSQCKSGDKFDFTQNKCLVQCRSGYTDGGYLCTNWSTGDSYWRDQYGLDYTLPTSDPGLLYPE